MAATKVEKCRACGHQTFVEIESLGSFHYANLFPRTASDGLQKHPLTLLICQNCSLCQLSIFPDLDELYTSYLWTTDSSMSIHNHLDELKKKLKNLTGNQLDHIIEIASNDGTFLKKFEGEAKRLIGVDPARNLSVYYRNTDVRLFTAFFSEDLLKSNPDVLSNAQLIVARNVLAHTPNLDAFLRTCKICLSEDGLLYLEFHDGGEVINKLQFDSIYHEHQSYITEPAIRLIVQRLGFTVIDCWRGSIGGSSLSLALKKSPDSDNALSNEHLAHQQEMLVRSETVRWQQFRREIDLYKSKVAKILNTLILESQAIVGFGASARSTTIASFCGIDRWLSAIVDSSKFKQGRMWTGTAMRITSPCDHDWTKIHAVVLFAWNFEHEIIAQLSNLGFSGQILRLLPYEPILIEKKNVH